MKKTSINLSKSAMLKLLAKLPEKSGLDDTKVVSTVHNFPAVITIGQYLALCERKNRWGLPTLLPHPRQRETFERLAKAAAAGGHLHRFSASHTEIVLAQFQGQLYIVDGNHRTQMWQLHPELPKPSHVNLIIKYFDNEKDFTDIYYAYDSKASLETGRQKLYGYMSAAKYADKLQSKFMKEGKFLSALKHLPGYLKGDEARLLVDWKEQICALDKDLSRDTKVFHNGVIAGLLNAYRKKSDASLVSDFVWAIQDLKHAVRVSNVHGAQMSSSDVVVKNFVDNLGEIFGINNEDTIRLKKEATLREFENYKKAVRFDALKANPTNRLKKAA